MPETIPSVPVVSTLEPAGGTTRRVAWWMNALDVLTVGALVLAVLALVGFGLRLQVGSLVISLRTPYRLLGWAAALAAGRHLLRSRPTLPARVRAWRSIVAARAAAVGARYPAAAAVLTPFLVSRFGILLVAYFALTMIWYPPAGMPWRVSANEFLNLPYRWDAGYYLGIATRGYPWDGHVSGQGPLAFFPAYPMAARVVGWLFGAEAGLFIVPLVSFFWALTYFYRLACEHLEPTRARAAVLFLCFYPFALFYSAAYSESLFLLAAVGVFYHFRRAEWLRASAWGLVIGLTRPNGFLLCSVMGVLALEHAWRTRRCGAFDRREWHRLMVSMGVASTPVIGLAAHCAFVYSLTGDPFTWMRIQDAWGRSMMSPSALLDWLNRVAAFGLYGYTRRWPIDAANALAAVFAVVALWPVTRRFGAAYGLFVALNLLPAMLTGGTMSIGRFTSTLFPIFLWLGAVVAAERRVYWIASFAMLQAVFAAVFFTWRPLV